MKEHFDFPSEQMRQKMIAAGFTIGLPTEVGQYLVAQRTNDERELYCVHFVTFNPMSLHKFFIGGLGAGFSTDQCEPYRFREKIRAYMRVPSF